MKRHYRDILDRVAEEPLWFDEHGVPRFSAFSINEIADIYATEAALVLVTCQGCGREFRVAFSRCMEGEPLSDQIRAKSLHYGYPPNIECCEPGPTMNSEPRKVLQFWRRFFEPDFSIGYTRDQSLEIDITPDWVTADTETGD